MQEMERVKAGDRAAFAAVVKRHQRVVYGYLRARVLQTSDAEDLAQEVFLRFYKARHRFDSTSPVRPWLMGIARNVLREHVRRCRRQREVAWTELCLEVEEDAAGDDRYEDAIIALPGCLETLGDNARKAIDLRYSGELGLAEIGRMLRRSEGAVKLLMFRARQALRRCLTSKVDDPAHG